jgi:hypothetical protein
MIFTFWKGGIMDFRSSAGALKIRYASGLRAWTRPRVTLLDPCNIPREVQEEIARQLKDLPVRS